MDGLIRGQRDDADSVRCQHQHHRKYPPEEVDLRLLLMVGWALTREECPGGTRHSTPKEARAVEQGEMNGAGAMTINGWSMMRIDENGDFSKVISGKIY